MSIRNFELHAFFLLISFLYGFTASREKGRVHRNRADVGVSILVFSGL